jgi:hypothetical protein
VLGEVVLVRKNVYSRDGGPFCQRVKTRNVLPSDTFRVMIPLIRDSVVCRQIH